MPCFRPVIIEVPHFASLRGREREVIVMRSDNGETWREHTLEASEEAVQKILSESFDKETGKFLMASYSHISFTYNALIMNLKFLLLDLNALEPDFASNRITRILTTEFPQYFAIITRIRQEVHAIGPEGGMVNSTVVPQVQAVFPEGALTKRIKVGLQVRKRKNKKNDENDNTDDSDPGDTESSKGRKRKQSRLSMFGHGFTQGLKKFSRKKDDSLSSAKTEEKASSPCPNTSTTTGNEISMITSTTQDAITPISETSGKISGEDKQIVTKKIKQSRDAKPVSGCWGDIVRMTMPNLDLFARMV